MPRSYKKDEITVSPKYGVNPMLTKCFFCNEDKNEILLLGHLTRSEAAKMFGKEIALRMRGTSDDVEAPRGLIVNNEPCDKCAKLMNEGIIFISFDESKTDDRKNPYRSGGWCVLREEAVVRMLAGEPALLEHTLAVRFTFVTDEAWDLIGLPRGATKEEENVTKSDKRKEHDTKKQMNKDIMDAEMIAKREATHLEPGPDGVFPVMEVSDEDFYYPTKVHWLMPARSSTWKNEETWSEGIFGELFFDNVRARPLFLKALRPKPGIDETKALRHMSVVQGSREADARHKEQAWGRLLESWFEPFTEAEIKAVKGEK